MIKIKVGIDYSNGYHKYYATTEQKCPEENFGMGPEIFEGTYEFKIKGIEGFFLLDERGFVIDDSMFPGCVAITVLEGRDQL